MTTPAHDEPRAPLELAPPPPPQRRQPSFARRFLLGYLALAALVAAAVAGFLYLQGREPADARVAAFSDWQPFGFGFERALQIGDHVSLQYRRTNGRMLVSVDARHPRQLPNPLTVISTEYGADDVKLDDGETSVVYQMCGYGQQCSFDEQMPEGSTENLLRRQALELALYTFHYMPEINGVVVVGPPIFGIEGGQQVRVDWTIYFRRADLREQLARPLRETLPREVPPRPSEPNRLEAQTIVNLTFRRTFTARFDQLPTRDAWLVQQPLTDLPGI